MNIGLVNKVSDSAIINQALSARSSAGISFVSCPRSGAAFLAFAAERKLLSSNKLRQAVTHLIDKQNLASTFLKGHGNPVYYYYGMGQWMVKEKGDVLKKTGSLPLQHRGRRPAEARRLDT